MPFTQLWMATDCEFYLWFTWRRQVITSENCRQRASHGGPSPSQRSSGDLSAWDELTSVTNYLLISKRQQIKGLAILVVIKRTGRVPYFGITCRQRTKQDPWTQIDGMEGGSLPGVSNKDRHLGHSMETIKWRHGMSSSIFYLFLKDIFTIV